MSLHKTKPNAKGETAKYHCTALVNYCGELGKYYCTINRSETSSTQDYVLNMAGVGWGGMGILLSESKEPITGVGNDVTTCTAYTCYISAMTT